MFFGEPTSKSQFLEIKKSFTKALALTLSPCTSSLLMYQKLPAFQNWWPADQCGRGPTRSHLLPQSHLWPERAGSKLLANFLANFWNHNNRCVIRRSTLCTPCLDYADFKTPSFRHSQTLHISTTRSRCILCFSVVLLPNYANTNFQFIWSNVTFRVLPLLLNGFKPQFWKSIISSRNYHKFSLEKGI